MSGNLDPAIYLYDLTSTYFEGLAANPKAKRGYSRDGRPDCKQVVVGLVVGREGFPICHEVFAGHKPGSLYEAFPAEEARRLVERFEWHYTPKHGSWLDMAECELAVLTTQCLDRRIADKPTLIGEVAAWESDRNTRHTKTNWRFTTQDARVKLKRLYPRFE